VTTRAPAPAPGRLTPVACPACAAAGARHELVAADPVSGHAFTLVRCLGCGLVYVSPRPEGALLAAYYEDYYGERHVVLKQLFLGARVRRVGPPQPGGRLLDIGCGSGEFLLACKRRGWDVVGIEHERSPIIERCAALGLTVETPATLPALPDASFHVVSLSHVLEHLPNPRKVLLEAHRVLVPGGRLLVETPNFGSWQARLSGRTWHHLDVPRHLLHFDRAALEGLLAAAGFASGRWQTFSLEYDTFGLVQSILDRVCRQPNHLFSLLRGKRSAGSRRDTALSLALLVPLALVAGMVSVVAPLGRRGGVLRVEARKRSAP